MKNFCSSKDRIKKMKRQVTDWEKIFTVYISNKGPNSGMQKELQVNKETRKLN